MCFKRKDTLMDTTERRILTFGKNKYPGGNSLQGCVHDSENLIKKSLNMFSDFDIRKYIDNQVTGNSYLSKGLEAIKTLRQGGTVLILSDSCFSGTNTRGLLFTNNGHPTKSRFFDPGLPDREIIRSKMFSKKENMKWIAMSACGEHQTAADAYLNRQYEGAFTHFAMIALRKGMTYREWYAEIRKYLPSKDFDQIPMIEGADYLLDRKVFEGQTLVIHNSSHGSWIYDKNGDETDGKDEGIYFDRLVTDDEIYNIAQQIPSLN